MIHMGQETMRYCMHYFFLLAFVQGIAEAFPISSSAHLLILAHVLGIQPPSKALAVALHLGTLLAIGVVFHKACFRVLRGCLDLFRGHASQARHFFLTLVIATLPVLFGGLGIHLLGLNFDALPIMAINTMVFGVLLWVIDRTRPSKAIALEKISYGTGIVLGCFQMLALIPGVSRLGICIMAGRLMGMNLASSTRFSFLLGIPVIASAIVLKHGEIINSNLSLASFFSMTGITFFLGIPCILFFESWVKTHTITPFVLYRLGIGIVLCAMIGGWI